MAGDDDKTQLQALRIELDGLVTDITMIHGRMDSTVTTANERFDQLDLAQTSTKTTLDTIVSRLDALNIVVTDLVAQGCVGDDEPEDADRRGKAHRVPRPPVMILFLRLNLKFHRSVVNMILLHTLIGN
jgi:predicted O-methyltransferase YrrM